jgi:hypothetical protein
MDRVLLDLLINIVSIILGGGIILMIIEWRRHQREKRLWAREDQLLEIDIPRADLRVRKWQITDKTPDDIQLRIYQNKLEDTVMELLAVAHFVIRNTTGAEIIVTSYTAKILNIARVSEYKGFYDLETADSISVEDICPVKLRPYTTIPRIVILWSNFDEHRKLERVPSTLVVEATTSSGATIRGTAALSVVPHLPDVEFYEYSYHPKRYIDKIRPLEEPPEEGEEIPF